MTDRKDMDFDPDMDLELDELFAEARETAPVPSSALLARVMADAEAELDARGAGVPAWAAPTPKAPDRHPLIKAALAALGGWRGVSGLATATIAGLVIGLGAPDTVTGLTTGSWSDSAWSTALTTTDTSVDTASYALDDLVPSFYDLATEG